MRQREAGGRGQPNTVSLTPLCPLGPAYTREQVGTLEDAKRNVVAPGSRTAHDGLEKVKHVH